MYHKHFEVIDSTQIYLKAHLEELLLKDDSNLISCNKQTNGIGRTGNSWLFVDRSLAMSFTISPNKTLTLTPLEIGILTCQFLKVRFNLQVLLKWPNDLMSIDNKKLGGVITHYHNNKTILVGIGINIGEINLADKTKVENFRHGIDAVKLTDFIQKDLSLELYSFILNNRIKNNELLVQNYNQLCCHLNKKVSIDDHDNKNIGIFVGISPTGAAIINNIGNQSIHIAGSLTIY